MRGPRDPRETGQRRLQELERALRGTRQRGRERDPQEVERGSQRDDVEVAGRYDPTFESNDDGVSLVGVQLDGENSRGVGKRIARCSLDVWERAEGEGILEVPRLRFPQGATVEERSQSSNRRRETRMWTGVADSWSMMLRFAANASRSSARDVERRAASRSLRPRAPRERVVVDEHERFARRKRELAEYPLHEIRVRRKVSLADRTENSDVRDRAGVQGIDQELRELGPHA